MSHPLTMNQRVQLTQTGSDLLDGQCGTILGSSMVNLYNFYIVLLDIPTETHRALSLPESCLTALHTLEGNLPCPFCGKPVDLKDNDTLYPSGILWHLDPHTGVKSYHSLTQRRDGDHFCYSMNCPTTSGGCNAKIDADSRAEALAAWNTRVL